MFYGVSLESSMVLNIPSIAILVLFSDYDVSKSFYSYYLSNFPWRVLCFSTSINVLYVFKRLESETSNGLSPIYRETSSRILPLI